MVSPLLYDEGLPNVATGTTYQFRGFSVQFPDIIKSNLRRLTVAEANAGISNWNFGSWTTIPSIGTFANYQVDGLTGRPVSSGGYIFFETDDGANPVTPWKPWWPKASAPNTYYGLNASGQGNPLDEFEYFAGNFIPSESDQYYTSDIRNQVFKESTSDIKKYFIIKLYDNWCRASKSVSNPHGVSLHVPGQGRYAIDSTGPQQIYIQYGYTSYSSPTGNTAPYYYSNALVTPICKTDGTSATSSYVSNYSAVGDWWYTPSELTRFVRSSVGTWPIPNPISYFVTYFHTIDQYQTSSYVGAPAPSISENSLPLYMVNNSTMQRMSVSQLLSEYVLPAIDLMCGRPSSAGFPSSDSGYDWLPYTISTSTSVSGYSLMSGSPIFTDYRSTGYFDSLRATTTAYPSTYLHGYTFYPYTSAPLQYNYFSDGSTPLGTGLSTTVQNYYLHTKGRAYSAGNYSPGTNSPFVVLNGSTMQPLTVDQFLSNVLTPLFEWAMVNYGGYRVRYVMSPIRSLANQRGLQVDTQLGTTMINTSLNTIQGLYNYGPLTTGLAANDYRMQLFPTGGATNRDYYSLNLVRY